MIFRDEYERKAMDIICIIKYGSIGGQANAKDVERVGDILRGHPFKRELPKVSISLPPVLPTIKLP